MLNTQQPESRRWCHKRCRLVFLSTHPLVACEDLFFLCAIAKLRIFPQLHAVLFLIKHQVATIGTKMFEWHPVVQIEGLACLPSATYWPRVARVAFEGLQPF